MKVNENRFYQALENIFTGANIEGDSGYVNLLKIKSRYYKIILEQFQKEISNKEMITDSFKEEFFDKLNDEIIAKIAKHKNLPEQMEE